MAMAGSSGPSNPTGSSRSDHEAGPSGAGNRPGDDSLPPDSVNNKSKWQKFVENMKRTSRVYPKWPNVTSSFMKPTIKRPNPHQGKGQKYGNLLACFQPKVDKKMKGILTEDPVIESRTQQPPDQMKECRVEVRTLVNLMGNDINGILEVLQKKARERLQSRFEEYAEQLLSKYDIFKYSEYEVYVSDDD